MLALKGAKRLLIGFVLTGLGFLRLVDEAEVVEKNFAELFGRGDVEASARMLLDALREPVNLLLQFHADRCECTGVDRDAFHFHAREHRQKRRFNFLKDAVLSGSGELRANFFGKLPCHICVFGSVLGQLFQWDRRDIQVLGGFAFRRKRKEIVTSGILLRTLR